MTRFVPRSKQEKTVAERDRVYVQPRAVRLSCGCVTRRAPAVSNPDRWWCELHPGQWRRGR